jgi:hypothetical protein
MVSNLPAAFDLTVEQAEALAIDSIVDGTSLQFGLFEMQSRIVAHAKEAYDRGDMATVMPLELLSAVLGMMLKDDRRQPFTSMASGATADGLPWRTAIPADLLDEHVKILLAMLATVKTPAIRARLADVLWHRLPRRNPEHARVAVEEYLNVAEVTFDPNNWVISEQAFSRAFGLAASLGSSQPEIQAVVAKAWSFLARLDGNDPLFYTAKLIDRISKFIENAEAEILLERVKTIIDAGGDFDRLRTYYDVAIRLARKIEHEVDVKALRLAQAETHVTQGQYAPTNSLKAVHFSVARQALLNAAADPARIAEVAAMLDEAQTMAVSEMTSVAVEMHFGDMPIIARDHVRGLDPVHGLWQLAGMPLLSKKTDIRRVAEKNVGEFHFVYGFQRRLVSSDGREQAKIPGAIGADEYDREAAVIAAMREVAAHSRLSAVVSAIEPARHQLLSEHAYSLDEIFEALRDRPLIPAGHCGLWAKGIHAGLVGEYDVAAHILAPQMENALREVLRRHGHIVYTTQNNFQRLLSLEDVLGHEASAKIFDENYIFVIDTALANRLGANLRNNIAHGLLSDASSSTVETAYLWWLSLNLLRAYGPDPLSERGIAVKSSCVDEPDPI